MSGQHSRSLPSAINLMNDAKRTAKRPDFTWQTPILGTHLDRIQHERRMIVGTVRNTNHQPTLLGQRRKSLRPRRAAPAPPSCHPPANQEAHPIAPPSLATHSSMAVACGNRATNRAGAGALMAVNADRIAPLETPITGPSCDQPTFLASDRAAISQAPDRHVDANPRHGSPMAWTRRSGGKEPRPSDRW